jgi:hypothetical protein
MRIGLFGGHVIWSAQNLARDGQLGFGLESLGQAEVGDMRPVLGIHEHIGGF